MLYLMALIYECIYLLSLLLFFSQRQTNIYNVKTRVCACQTIGQYIRSNKIQKSYPVFNRIDKKMFNSIAKYTVFP